MQSKQSEILGGLGAMLDEKIQQLKRDIDETQQSFQLNLQQIITVEIQRAMNQFQNFLAPNMPSSEEEEELGHDQLQSSDNEDEVSQNRYKPLFDPSKPAFAGGSSLSSVFDAFSEVSGPPQFLNNCVEEPTLPTIDVNGSGGRWNRKKKRDLLEGAVLEAKPQLVGTHERVWNDIEGNLPPFAKAVPNQTSATFKHHLKMEFPILTNENLLDGISKSDKFFNTTILHIRRRKKLK